MIIVFSPRILGLLLAAALPLLAACQTDCDVVCEKQNQCLSLGGEAEVTACVEQCSRDVEEDEGAEEMELCATCFEATECAELYPADGSLGACVEDC